MTHTSEKLVLSGVGKDYRGKAAVSEVDLAIAEGEFVSFLGPSGSGKTTTLRMIAGFIQPDRGHIVLDGVDLTTTPPHKREMGMVFQNYALFPHLNVAQNLAFPLKMRGVAKSEISARVARYLDLIHLSDHGDRKITEISGGQAQRVALARAMIAEPGILLMDEPLGALDKNLRERMQLEIMQISQDAGATVVYVTHDQSEALAMSDRIAIYNEGAIQQLGTGRELYEEPRSLFVATFMGESNVIRGTVSSADGRSLRGVNGELLKVSEVAAKRVGLREGTAGAIVIRPDRIRLVATGSTETDNRVDATVVNVLYLGERQRVLLETQDGNQIIVDVPSHDGLGVRPGETTGLGWNADAGVIVADAH